MTVKFFVPGRARPKGSKTVGTTAGGETFVREADPREHNWRAAVGLAAHEAMAGQPPLSGAVRLELTFLQQLPDGDAWLVHHTVHAARRARLGEHFRSSLMPERYHRGLTRPRGIGALNESPRSQTPRRSIRAPAAGRVPRAGRGGRRGGNWWGYSGVETGRNGEIGGNSAGEAARPGAG